MTDHIFSSQSKHNRSNTSFIFADFLQGATPIYVAAQEGHSDTVRILAESHADVNVPHTQVCVTLCIFYRENFSSFSKVITDHHLFRLSHRTKKVLFDDECLWFGVTVTRVCLCGASNVTTQQRLSSQRHTTLRIQHS